MVIFLWINEIFKAQGSSAHGGMNTHKLLFLAEQPFHLPSVEWNGLYIHCFSAPGCLGNPPCVVMVILDSSHVSNLTFDVFCNGGLLFLFTLFPVKSLSSDVIPSMRIEKVLTGFVCIFLSKSLWNARKKFQEL